jgi:hypothetical protein
VNAGALRGIFEQWTTKARKIGRAPRSKSGKARPAAARGQTQTVREWTRKNGYTISQRGRIQADVVKAYWKANR